ncbi:MAG: EamA family transporter [Solirubrobacterales bacterium]
MLGIALGLASSGSWGIADWLGGTSARRLPLALVVLITQVTALALLVVALPLLQPGAPQFAGVLAGVAAGVSGVIGQAAYYRSLAMGPIGVVAPIGALSVVIPAAVGIGRGEEIAGLALTGMAVATIGVVVAVREPTGAERVRPAAIGLALVAALGFGGAFVGIDASADTDALWVLLWVRLPGVVLPAMVVLGTRQLGTLRGGGARALPLIGFFDLLAVAAYAQATVNGPLALVAVSASLYPVVAAGLAASIGRERLAMTQVAGSAVAVAGVLLIAAATA